MANRDTPSEQAENETLGWLTLLKILIVLPVMGCIFVVIWACLNFAWGTALEKFITPAVFAEPCKRLAASATPLSRYEPRETSRRGKLLRMARCHFGEQAVIVYEPVWEREFAGREFWLLVVVYDLGLMACFVAAFYCTFRLFLLAQGTSNAFTRWLESRKQP